MIKIAVFRVIIRDFLVKWNLLYLRKVWGMKIGRDVRISFKARLDKVNPRGVCIGDESYISAGACILTHDFLRKFHCDTVVGRQCFIGMDAIVLPGVVIGDNCIVAAGSVVTGSIPSNCLIGGNPARIIRHDIKVGSWGQYID